MFSSLYHLVRLIWRRMERWNEAAPPDIENPLSAPQKKKKKSLQDSLTEELDRLQRSPANLRCIHRVPRRLRDVRPKAYTPRVVSIGPLHHGKVALKAMEEHKMRYLDFFLRRSKSVGLDLMHYIKKVQGEEEKLRSCYSETIKLKSDAFVKIILVDAIFLIEFLFRNRYRQSDETDESDCLFKDPYMSNSVWLDLLMLENQLPFFILKLLFEPNIFRPISFDYPDGLLSLSLAFLVDRGIYIGERTQEEEEELNSKTIEYCSTEEVQHLVDLLRMIYITPAEVKKGYVAPGREPEATTRPIAESGQQGKPTAQSTASSRNGQQHKGAEAKPTPSIQKLRQAGVQFKARVQFEAHSFSNLFDIQFDNGVLEIPKLKIQDSTEVIIRNLVAYEQCHHQSHYYISDYVCMMDYLVDTTKDAELLVEHEIVQNRLGGGKQLSTLFNSMATEVGIHPTAFSYGPLCAALKDYYNSRWHKMIADLRQNYFNTPWAAISVIAAGFLLILTVILTICAIVSL